MAEIDIVVPIYNVESCVDECLRSLRDQTFSDIRVLCVNDGSTDNSQDIIDKYVLMDERFISLIKKNGGLSDARNYGLKRVNAPYVMFIDGDDICEKQMCQKALEAIKKDDSDMVVFNYTQLYTEDGREEVPPMRFNGCFALKEKKELLAYTSNAAWNKLYKSSLFLDNGLEYPFGLRHQDLGTTPFLLAYANKISYLNETLYRYRVDRPGNITKAIDKKLRDILDIGEIVVNGFKKLGSFDEYKEELNYLLSVNMIQSLRKAVKLTDAEFVNSFIDDIFAFKKKHFGRNPKKYPVKEAANDYIYLNKTMLKLYYRYRTRKEKSYG